MRKRFLLEGDYQEQAIWIGVEFLDEAVSLHLHLFVKQEVAKENLQKWVRNEGDLPASFEVITRSITDENLLTEEIKVKDVGRVRQIEIEWADNLLMTRMIQGFDGDLILLKEKVALLNDYSQDLFDECSSFWNRLLSFKKENHNFPNSKLDSYKGDLDILFEAMKSLRKDFKKEQKVQSVERKKNLLLKLEILNEKLDGDEKPNFKFTIERLKEIRTDLNKSGLHQKDYSDIDTQINALFDKMNASRKKLDGGKIAKRVSDLNGIIEKMQKSIDWEKRNLAKEERNKEYSEHAFQVKLLDAKISMIKDKLKEKEEKLSNVQATLQSLKKKL